MSATARPTELAAPGAAVIASAMDAARLVLVRDLRLAFRRGSELLQPLIFFAIVTTLFPLAVSPDLARLRAIAPGVLWVAALLASLLALEFLFREDSHDGSLEQYALSGQSLTWLLFAKTLTHWLLTGVPLAIMTPIAGLALGVPLAAVPGILANIALGSISLSLIGAISAALTLGVRRGGVLLSLLTLPLAMPVLIFGARGTELAIRGGDFSASLYLLGAMAVLGITLAPLAAAGAVRISLE
jgi:heme exporter protein B